MNTWSNSSSAPLTGLLPSRFRILRELGNTSGQGRVFAVIDQKITEDLHGAARRRQLRVVKVCRRPDGTLSEEVRQRLAVEFMLLGSIDDPNIVRVFERIRDDAYGDHLVLGYYRKSIDLEARLRSEPISRLDALHIARGLCKGVSAAHRHRVIHRDIKPANFLVVKRESGLDAVLLDFGIGKSFLPETHAVTRLGQAPPMTPAYASPEQIRGEDATPASDVFSLGMVVYEVLTGHRAFRPEDLKLLAGFHSVPEPPLPPVVPSTLAKQLLVALSPDPKLRGSASRLLECVAALIHDDASATATQAERDRKAGGVGPTLYAGATGDRTELCADRALPVEKPDSATSGQLRPGEHRRTSAGQPLPPGVRRALTAVLVVLAGAILWKLRLAGLVLPRDELRPIKSALRRLGSLPHTPCVALEPLKFDGPGLILSGQLHTELTAYARLERSVPELRSRSRGDARASRCTVRIVGTVLRRPLGAGEGITPVVAVVLEVRRDADWLPLAQSTPEQTTAYPRLDETVSFDSTGTYLSRLSEFRYARGETRSDRECAAFAEFSSRSYEDASIRAAVQRARETDREATHVKLVSKQVWERVPNDFITELAYVPARSGSTLADLAPSCP